jgi:hypothetical protein
LSPTTSFISNKKPETSTQESEIAQVSIQIEASPSKDLISEQYHSEDFVFPKAPLEEEENPQREMTHTNVKEETSSFIFPIRGSNEETKMNNIPLSTLPNFHGLSKEYPETFLFKFNVLCRSYDYVLDAQKLKLFPSTLNNFELCWFMGLSRDYIHTWD